MLRFLCKTRTRRIISFYLLISLLADVLYPASAMALTGGPSTPEVQSFEPISTSEMVDPFSGDFKYNIPLMDVGGYPVNVAYASGISTDQEASWVGLGWNLNVGNISRGMRGIPDDFNGKDIIKKEFNMKPNRTYGINGAFDWELFGKESKTKTGKKKTLSIKARVGVGINYNNYTGFGVETSIAPGISAGVGGKGLDASLGLHSSSTGGLDISPNISFTARSEKQIDKTNDYLVKSGGLAIGGAFNSRAGLKQLSFSADFQKSTQSKSTYKDRGGHERTGYSSPESQSMGSGTSINFGLQTYVPHINMPMENNSVQLSFKTGVHMFGVDGNLTLGGYFSSQKLATNNKDVPAYGYMYSEQGQNDENAMMDFNREKDGSFSRFTKNLPLSNFTYDVYSASGQGVGGIFRPFRHDYGHVFDNFGNSTSDSYSIGGELGAGNLFKGGLNITVVDVINKTSKWSDKNKALSFFKFNQKSTSQLQDEPYYFRAVGEKTADNANLSMYSQLGGEDAFAIKLKQSGSNSSNITAEKELVKFDDANSSLPLPASSNNTNREKRNQNFSVLTIQEATLFGLQKDYYNNTGVPDFKNTPGNLAKAYTTSNAHHIAEISVLNTDGARYVYGLPAYNKKQKEVNFNCSGLTLNTSNGFVSGFSAGDASVNNNRGTDNNFGSTEMPAYAYSYLLTAIVSVDYVDVTGNGPTDDDLGSYTKFHYKKSGGNNDYNWRLPATATNVMANFNEGSKSKTNDQSASYSYGEKELWFLDEIETKNYIAVFETSDRLDALGVTSAGGPSDMGYINANGTGVNCKRLDKITLYSKPEYNAAVPGSPAVPIKVVNFVYDYSLCGGTYNSGAAGTQGKLTLKSIYFTYGKSDRARFNKYDFTYGTISTNPNYNPKAYDRWGNYKPEITPISYAYNSPNLSNAEFPYTEQNKTLQDQYAQAWHLTKINLPSGGEINVTYESDDYAYVQNYPAGQMFKVLGASKNAPSGPYSTSMGIWNLYDKVGSNYDNNLYITVEGVPNGTSAADFRKYYLKDINNENKRLYFKFLVNLTSATSTPVQNQNFFEYVSGYAEISPDAADYGTISGTNQAWFKLKAVPVKRQNAGDPINPIALAAIQFGRLNYGEQMWDKIANPPADVEEALKQLANDAFGSLKTMITGFKNPNKAIADKEYCREFVSLKSQVRLYNGTGKKLGGGSRVKKLELVDNWQNMTTTGSGFQDNSTYGQEYNYTKTDEYGRTISSGVASYEPMIGGEENSMKQPRYFGKNKWAMLAPDDRFFSEGPYGESFYPSPNVGYEQVKVTSIFPPNALTDQKNGYKVFEYYTAKDYPTLTEETPIIPKQHRPPLGNLLKVLSRDFIYTSQGYVIKTNDMHGKPKAELDYAEGKIEPMKEVRFFYKTKGGQYWQPTQKSLYSDASYNWNELDNVCQVIQTDGTVTNKTIGVDFDAVADFRESETNSTSVGVQTNVSNFLVALFPAVFPTVWPSFSKEISRFRSAVLTKIVNQYGILERTEIKENGSVVNTENLAYDAETGEVLVTKTKNGFNDDIYSLKYPSHWGYDLMGHAYKNLGIELAVSSGGSGVAMFSGASAYLLVGDEVGLTGTSDNNAWVCSIGPTSIGLINRFGSPISTTGISKLKVIRSARRNLLNTDMANLTSLVNPLPAGPGAISVSGATKVLNANGAVFSDVWQMPKGKIYSTGATCICANLTATGTQLVNILNSLLNNDNNAPTPLGVLTTRAFFNGVTSAITGGPPVVLNSTPSILGVNFTNGSHLYRVNNIVLPPSLITPGFNNSAGWPNFNNYGLINNTDVFAQIPSFTPPSPAPFVGWAGPPVANNLSPFNNSNQLIGYFMSDDPRCYVVLDFGAVNPWLDPNFVNWIAIPQQFIFILDPNVTQTSCSGNEINCLFKVQAVGGSVLYSTPVTISSPSCLSNLVTNCSSTPGTSYQCGKLQGELVNPFTTGIKGNWRPKINYSYLTGRVQTISASPTNNTNIRGDGYFATFSPLYSPGSIWPANTSGWTNTVETSKVNQYGVEIENKDALGRYSSALYGYNESLPIAVASNARLREIAYDGFEDYSYYPNSCIKESHFTFIPNIGYGQTVRNSQNAHTGKYSLQVAPNNIISMPKTVSSSHQATGSNSSFCNYLLGDYDFIYPFSPVSASANPNGVNYVISYWVKQTVTAGTSLPINYTNSGITVTNALNIAFAISQQKRSPIIDGWQREEYTFTIPTNYSGNMYIKLNNSSAQTAYFDDIRIHPFSSNMKSYVYHPVSLKYVAELDANNFATFYEYDEQGNLIRVKKETEKGIMTIQESKTHYKNKP